MKSQVTKFYLTDDEHTLLIHGLNTFRNKLINAGRHTDFIDEVLLKVVTAKTKKVKIT